MLTIAPSTCMQVAQTADQPVSNLSTATTKCRKNKCKAPCDEEDPAPAEAPLPTKTQCRAKPKPKPKPKKGKDPTSTVCTDSTLSGDGPISNSPAGSQALEEDQATTIG
ncbi:hypothetical protein FRC00_001171 [Tulasnella sp. 408]|nr:hypothetical protein FRC00_001171 [Tulasnella sp. 408]